MTPYKVLARTLGLLLVSAALVVAGTGPVNAEELDFPALEEKAPRIIDSSIENGQSRLTISAPTRNQNAAAPAGVDKSSMNGSRSLLVALPCGTTSYQLNLEGPATARASAPEGLMSLRGQPVLRVLITGVGDQTVDLTVSHDGRWGQVDPRLHSAGMAAALGATLPRDKAAAAVSGGTFLMIHAPAFTQAIAPLVDWKTRKGYEVVTVSTAVTGASNEGIKDYIQTAYDSWDSPPEYVLLVGDVNEIPTFNFYANPSDQSYVMLDGDDWLMDAAIGRLPVENDAEARALINKTINYERYPNMATDNTWQTRSLMVAGIYASDTPGYTVDFCGEMLEDMGFPEPTTVESPPLPSLQGAQVVRGTINNGVGMVVYRGWAYGTAGWDPPTFTVDDIPSLDTNDMTPIVMSFVCLNGDYTASSPCFGEVFVRQGSPEQPGKGAVAFIGNGEHWSHTRYNDAMAISIFEIIGDDQVTDLGTLLNAGKMRFMDYFPNEISAAEFGEESVEFYFHIYNLMGDPSLKFWKQQPEAITVVHPTNLVVGANLMTVAVEKAADSSVVAGARVGVAQDGVLIGHGVTGADGTVDLTLTGVATGSDISVTVSEAGVQPYEGVITTGTAGGFLASSSLDIDDSSGNGNMVPNPGEVLALSPTIRNYGSSPNSGYSLSISEVSGPATSDGSSVVLPDIPAGGEVVVPSPLGLTIDADAQEGSLITLTLDAVGPGNVHNYSALELMVAAPRWGEASLAAADGSAPLPGQMTNLALTLRNTGSIASQGGTVDLTLLTPGGSSLGTTSAALGACQPGETVTTDAVFDLNVTGDTATNTNLTFGLMVTTTEGYLTDTTCAAVVGPVDVSSPVGPDEFGYFAYDSADFDYPASRPIYAWTEISTEMGGLGTKLDFPVENEVVWMVVDLPFTFRFYGQDYTQARVSDNGWISFDTGTDYDFYNWTIPTQYGVEAVVAPFWDNLNPVPPGGSQENPNGIDPDGIYTYHDAAAGAFIVEWSRLPHYKPEILGLQTFQVALMDPGMHPTASGNGEMLFLYRNVNNNDHLRMYATVGIESPDGTDGLQLSYGNVNASGMAPLQPGLAVRVTTEAPVRVPFALTSMVAMVNGDQITVVWEPADERPVVGWHVDRIRGTERVRLTAAPLAGTVRRFSAPANGDASSDRYVLTALHPYNVKSEPGQTKVGAVPTTRLALYPAHPNPAPGQATIGFALPAQAHVRLKVYDMAGRLVRTLVDGQVSAGEGVKIWDGRDDAGKPSADGVYFFRLETGTNALTRKMILLR